jgi:hypothetical protein
VEDTHSDGLYCWYFVVVVVFFFFYRAALAKAYQTAAVLFDVLKAVNRDKTEEPPPEVSFKTGIH